MKISFKGDINSISYFKANFNTILEQMNEHHRPLILTQNGKSIGVFLDIDSWKSLLKKSQLLKLINEGERSLQNDKQHSLEDVEEYYQNKYGF